MGNIRYETLKIHNSVYHFLHKQIVFFFMIPVKIKKIPEKGWEGVRVLH